MSVGGVSTVSRKTPASFDDHRETRRSLAEPQEREASISLAPRRGEGRGENAPKEFAHRTPELRKHRSSNAELNLDACGRSMFGVRCSLFDVPWGSWKGRDARLLRFGLVIGVIGSPAAKAPEQPPESAGRFVDRVRFADDQHRAIGAVHNFPRNVAQHIRLQSVA